MTVTSRRVQRMRISWGLCLGLIHAGTVAADTKAAQSIDVSGKTITPGLINGHGHVSDVEGKRTGATEESVARQLGVFARYGITTVLSLGGEEEAAFKLRDAQGTPALNRARI